MAAPSSEPQLSEEQIILDPKERRDAVIRLLRSAQRHVALSVFRCTDFKVMDELADALQRKAKVELLLTKRAKGWKKRLKDLGAYLESMGAAMHRYSNPGVKYHAKYLVADDAALIMSLNFTRKCFSRTCDFMVQTYDPGVVSSLRRLFEADCRAAKSLPEKLSDRLIVGPERARSQFAALLKQASKSIRIIDHKVVDPEMAALLKAKEAEGVEVKVLGRGQMGSLVSHGKLMLVDEKTAVVGSISLSPPSLDLRREVALVVREPRGVEQLSEFFRSLSAARPAVA